jgi:hypothetical protein
VQCWLPCNFLLRTSWAGHQNSTPQVGDIMRPSKPNILRFKIATETHGTAPEAKKCGIMVGDTCEELGFGLPMGLNLIIYVSKH